MADPYVRQIGRLSDADGVLVAVGVDYDLITLAGRRLTAAQVEELAQLLVRATWEAARQVDGD